MSSQDTKTDHPQTGQAKTSDPSKRDAEKGAPARTPEVAVTQEEFVRLSKRVRALETKLGMP